MPWFLNPANIFWALFRIHVWLSKTFLIWGNQSSLKPSCFYWPKCKSLTWSTLKSSTCIEKLICSQMLINTISFAKHVLLCTLAYMYLGGWVYLCESLTTCNWHVRRATSWDMTKSFGEDSQIFWLWQSGLETAIHSYHKYLLNVYFPGTVLGQGMFQWIKQ